MRVLVFSSICVCAAIAAPGFARAQDFAAGKAPPQVQASDPAAFDPFAAAEAREASAPALAAETKPVDVALDAVPIDAQTDPFEQAKTAQASDDDRSRLTRSVDLLYQGAYLPSLRTGHGGDQAEQDSFVDAAVDWAASENASLGARVVADHEESKSGSVSSHRNDVTALEYFYRQQFTDATQALTIGRKILGWSSGFQWRPADLIDNGFSTKNIDIQDPYRYRGVDQLRYELIWPKFDAVAIVSNYRKEFFGGEQLAAKLTLKGAADVSLMMAHNGDYSRKVGVIVDGNLPWGMTLALEAVHIEVDKTLLRDAAHFGRTLESLSGTCQYEDIYLSLSKFIDDKHRVSLEYFHNGRGLGDASGRAASAGAGAGNTTAVVDPSLFSQQYLGRNYLYLAYAGYIDAWKLQFKPSVLSNTGDGSFIGSISLKRELGDSSELTLNMNAYHGGDRSEFGAVTNGVGVGVSYVFHLF